MTLQVKTLCVKHYENCQVRGNSFNTGCGHLYTVPVDMAFDHKTNPTWGKPNDCAPDTSGAQADPLKQPKNNQMWWTVPLKMLLKIDLDKLYDFANSTFLSAMK